MSSQYNKYIPISYFDMFLHIPITYKLHDSHVYA